MIILLALTLANYAYASQYSKPIIQDMIIDYAQHYSDVPPALALALAHIESHFQAEVVSHKGAVGIMQIMPATASGEFHINEHQLYNPRTNIAIGIQFLEKLYHAYGRWDLALSHYNGGSLKIKNGQYIAHGYTQKYVNKVIKKWRYYQRALAKRNLIKAKNKIQAAAFIDDSSGHLAAMAIDHVKLHQHHDWQESLKIAENWLRYKNINKARITKTSTAITSSQANTSITKISRAKISQPRFTW